MNPKPAIAINITMMNLVEKQVFFIGITLLINKFDDDLSYLNRI